jgi:hypothetical protein
LGFYCQGRLLLLFFFWGVVSSVAFFGGVFSGGYFGVFFGGGVVLGGVKCSEGNRRLTRRWEGGEIEMPEALRVPGAALRGGLGG